MLNTIRKYIKQLRADGNAYQKMTDEEYGWYTVMRHTEFMTDRQQIIDKIKFHIMATSNAGMKVGMQKYLDHKLEQKRSRK